ncbi:amidohydrolase family protein [soil metagenome]
MNNEYIIKVKQVVGKRIASPPPGPVYLHVKKSYLANVTDSFQSLPSNLALVDESDKTALPGLIDMHVHLTRDEPGAAINLAPVYLAHGVTSVRDVGSDLQAIKKMRSRIDSGEVPGPRIFFCGPQLNGKAFRPGMCSLQTPDEARGKVHELYAEGVHALKIYDQLQPSLAQVVIEEARELALPVCGHLGKTTAREAISFGVSGVEHLTSLIFELFNGEPRNPFPQDLFRRVSEIDLHSSFARQLCKSAVAGGIYLDPTLVVYDRIRRFPELKGGEQSPVIPLPLRDYWLVRMSKFVSDWVKSDFELAKYSFDKLKSWLKFIESEGALICAGTDTPNPYLVPGQALLDEIKLLAEAGLSNAAAVGAATFVAAKALNQAGEIGAIEIGKRADFLLLQGDPLADISAVEKISAVFKDGVRYEPETLLRVAAEMSAGGSM